MRQYLKQKSLPTPVVHFFGNRYMGCAPQQGSREVVCLLRKHSLRRGYTLMTGQKLLNGWLIITIVPMCTIGDLDPASQVHALQPWRRRASSTFTVPHQVCSRHLMLSPRMSIS